MSEPFDHDPAKERELPTEEEIERALEVFEDPNHIYYEAAADNGCDTPAEGRRARRLRG